MFVYILSIYVYVSIFIIRTVFLQKEDCDWFIIDVCLALALSAADREVSSAGFMFS